MAELCGGVPGPVRIPEMGPGQLPFVRRFYRTTGRPGGGATLGMQLFVRGSLLVAIGILVIRTTAATRRGQVAHPPRYAPGSGARSAPIASS
jgi:hypothetical protein